VRSKVNILYLMSGVRVGVNQMPFKIELTNIEFDELLHPEEDEEDE